MITRLQGTIVLALFVVAQASAGDEDAAWMEDAVTLPSGPLSADLIEMDSGPTTSTRYLIDARSVAVGSDRVVRYVLVTRSRVGAVTASYEGLRCDSGEFKVFGSMREDGAWAGASNPVWRSLYGRGAADPRRILSTEYVCAYGRSVPAAAEIVRRLRAGGRWKAQN